MTSNKKVSGWFSWLPFGNVASISPEKAARLINNYLLIDVRTQMEFDKSHIPGAISLPLQSLNTDRINELPTDKPVICICLSAHRSKPATRKFIKAGFEAQELEGGMLAWWKLKLPIKE
ncbi:rhodanese-like domain-containing protein [uncultured Amphritea sp.]|uniref:rhodanese-like domain-containing protein n=1 Tax=uncultured Amphritea sp. TaxID=981605 RepID=UPI0026290925|nr:rhodanese-like domain-containing protein [uncultured Amphritea sp.]